MVAFAAGANLSTDASLGIAGETVAAFLAVGLATGAPTGTLLGYPFAYAGLWTTGLTRRASTSPGRSSRARSSSSADPERAWWLGPAICLGVAVLAAKEGSQAWHGDDRCS
jgi:hypothetical protein